MAETSEEVWYSLSRQSSKEEVKGELQLKIQLEAIEENIVSSHVIDKLTIFALVILDTSKYGCK